MKIVNFLIICSEYLLLIVYVSNNKVGKSEFFVSIINFTFIFKYFYYILTCIYIYFSLELCLPINMCHIQLYLSYPFFKQITLEIPPEPCHNCTPEINNFNISNG